MGVKAAGSEGAARSGARRVPRAGLSAVAHAAEPDLQGDVDTVSFALKLARKTSGCDDLANALNVPMPGRRAEQVLCRRSRAAGVIATRLPPGSCRSSWLVEGARDDRCAGVRPRAQRAARAALSSSRAGTTCTQFLGWSAPTGSDRAPGGRAVAPQPTGSPGLERCSSPCSTPTARRDDLSSRRSGARCPPMASRRRRRRDFAPG